MRPSSLSNKTAPKTTAPYILITGLLSIFFLVPLISSNLLTPLLFTLTLGLTVSIFALLLATAVLCAFERIHGLTRKVLLFFMPIPLVFPPYIAAITYVDIFKSPTFLHLFGRSEILEFAQATFVLSLFLYPYIFLLLLSRMRLINPHHYSILALHSFTFFKKLRIFYIPHLKYAAFSATLLVFLYTISDFGAVSILRMDTLTIRIYYEFITHFNKPEASIIAASFIGISLIAVYLSQRLGRKGTVYKNNTTQPSPYITKKTSIASIGFIVCLIFLSVGVPLLKISSWLYLYLIDTSAFKHIWISAKQPLFWTSIQSFGIAAIIALISISIPFLFYAMFRRRTLFQSSPYLLALVLHALPGIVIAFGVAVVKISLANTLFLSWLFLLSAYIYRYIGIAFIVIEPAIRAIPQSYLRTGSIFLKSKIAFITSIIFPLLKTSLMNSGNYIFFNSIRDLAIPLILAPLGVELLSVRIWQTANEGLYAYTAPAMIILLLLSLPSVIIFARNSI